MQTHAFATALLQEFALVHHYSAVLTVGTEIDAGRSYQESKGVGGHDGGEEGGVERRAVRFALLQLQCLGREFHQPIRINAGGGDLPPHEYSIKGWQHGGH
mmetsp:Transcript_5586/g.6373  ORF Transcript_5586/g.6373 Transcript_5586/m.6373 type:complete len:101 (-) Transcript_5586:948-1250(-)